MKPKTMLLSLGLLVSLIVGLAAAYAAYQGPAHAEEVKHRLELERALLIEKEHEKHAHALATRASKRKH